MTSEKKNLLVFGYGLAVILTFVAVRIWIKHHWLWVSAALLTAAVVLALISALNYQALKGFYTSWLKVAKLIGSIISTIILTLIFFLVFAPAGILLRILRKDLLEETIEKQKASYWNMLAPPSGGKERYLNQF